MPAPTLTARELRAAAHLADAIVGGYRATLLRDSPEFVEAVAEALAHRLGVDVAEATVILIEDHQALADWPDEIPRPGVGDTWTDPRRARRG